MSIYTATFYGVGNPDYMQGTGRITPERDFTGDSLAALQTEARAFIADFNLGGGNWPEIIVKRDGEDFARISYNGRLWHHITGVEIIEE